MSVSPPSATSQTPEDAPLAPTASGSQSGRGFVQDIILNIFEPGVNRSVLIFLNLAFGLLLLTLVGLTLLVGLDLHILLLTVLAVGLMIGFNWFISQLPDTAPDTQTTFKERDKQE